MLIRIQLKPGVLSGSLLRGYYLDGPCDLTIQKPVSALTLAQLFAIPLHWKGTFLVQPITTLQTIFMSKHGQVLGPEGNRQPLLPLLKPCQNLALHFWDSTASPQLASTMQHILKCIDPSFTTYSFWKTPFQREYQAIQTTRHLHISLDYGRRDVFDLCLQSVSTFSHISHISGC